METIVVGVDGSEPSQRALELAVREARLRTAKLRVIHTWFEPVVEGYFVAPQRYETEAAESAGKTILYDAVSGIADDVAVEPVLEHGMPARILIAESANAALVVVGSRGRGGFKGLLLGSVSRQVVHHAHCPVVVVRSSS